MVEYLMEENRIAAMVSLNAWLSPSDQIINEVEVGQQALNDKKLEPKGMV